MYNIQGSKRSKSLDKLLHCISVDHHINDSASWFPQGKPGFMFMFIHDLRQPSGIPRLLRFPIHSTNIYKSYVLQHKIEVRIAFSCSQHRGIFPPEKAPFQTHCDLLFSFSASTTLHPLLNMSSLHPLSLSLRAHPGKPQSRVDFIESRKRFILGETNRRQP